MFNNSKLIIIRDMINLENKKILVVEDDEMNLIYLTQIFKITHGDFTHAKNGKSALNIFKADSQWDVVLMDLQLPDINGLDVIREFRKRNPLVPIIAQTAAKSPEEQQEALRAGCNDLLLKPFTINTFNEVVGKYV